MSSERSWLTPKEAGELLNMTGRNVTNLIKKGKLRANKDEDGRYYIEKAEFFRAYPHTLKQEQERNEEKMTGKISMKFLEEKITHLQEMVAEKKRQNDFLTEQLQNFTHEKSKMLEAINSHARLLEHKEASSKPPKGPTQSSKFNLLKLFKK